MLCKIHALKANMLAIVPTRNIWDIHAHHMIFDMRHRYELKTSAYLVWDMQVEFDWSQFPHLHVYASHNDHRKFHRLLDYQKKE